MSGAAIILRERMKAELKSLSSPDVDLSIYYPQEEGDFGFLLEASIGICGNEAADLFQFMVCTPDWLKRTYAGRTVTWGRHMIIVFEYDLAEIRRAIARYVDACTGSSWHEIAAKINQIGGWEFENYQA